MALASRLLTVTQGNLNNKHMYLTEAWDLFPEDVFGGRNKSQAAPRTVCIQFGDKTVATDIDRIKKVFRRRDWVGRFYDSNRVQAGDRVLLEQVDLYRYRVSKA